MYNDYYCYYQVENSKTGGRVASSTLHIRWPYEVDSGYAHGKRLLYLMDPPVVCRHQFYFKFSSSVVFFPFSIYCYTAFEEQKMPMFVRMLLHYWLAGHVSQLGQMSCRIEVTLFMG